jgi:hypothetical protein
MDKSHLFEDEHILTESNTTEIVLTSHRLRQTISSWGKVNITSIMLEKISSIEVRYESSFILIPMGIVAIGYGVMNSHEPDSSIAAACFIGGLLILMIYLATRKHIISIRSDGGATMKFHTKGMKSEVVIDFINKVERAKNERSRLLSM